MYQTYDLFELFRFLRFGWGGWESLWNNGKYVLSLLRALWQCICDSSVPTMFTLFLGWGFGLSCTWNVALINNHKAFSWHGISFFRNSWKVNAKRIRTFFQLDLISTKSHLRVAITHARFLNYCTHHKRLKIIQNTRAWRREYNLQKKNSHNI